MTQTNIKVDRSVVANRPITGADSRTAPCDSSKRSGQSKRDQHKGIKKAYYILVGIAARPANLWAINSGLEGAGRLCLCMLGDTESQRWDVTQKVDRY